MSRSDRERAKLHRLVDTLSDQQLYDVSICLYFRDCIGRKRPWQSTERMSVPHSVWRFGLEKRMIEVRALGAELIELLGGGGLTMSDTTHEVITHLATRITFLTTTPESLRPVGPYLG